MKPDSHKLTVFGLTAIVLLAMGLRGAYYYELVDQPDFRWPLVDAGYYDYWARGLATGDWTVPRNFSDYGDPHIQTTPFFRPPGYPYFLAGVYRFLGDGYSVPRIIQMVLGCINCVLAFFMAKRLFGRTVGWLFALFMSTYWVFVYFEGQLLATSLLVTLILIQLIILTWWCDRLTFKGGLAAGTVFGLFAITRANILLAGPVILAWAWWLGYRQHAFKAATRTSLGFIVSVVVVIAPVTIRNYVVGRDTVLISSNAGLNFYIGNCESADGSYATIPDIRSLGLEYELTCFNYPQLAAGVERLAGHSMKPSEISSYFAQRAWDYIRTHPKRTLQLLAVKTGLFWGPYEVSNNKDLGLEREHSHLLRVLPGFPFALSIAVLGLLHGFSMVRQKCSKDVVTCKQFDVFLLITAFVLVYFISYLPFFMAGRFRVPVIPCLLLLGAFGIDRTFRLFFDRHARSGVVWLIVLICVYGVARRPPVSYQSDPAYWHLKRATCYRLENNLELAMQECRQVIQKCPDSEKGYRRLADLLLMQGDYSSAIQHYQRADQLRPGQFNVHSNLGLAFAKLGQHDKAIVHLQTALKIKPDVSDIHRRLAIILRQQGRVDEAIVHYRRAVDLSPTDLSLREDLAKALMSRRQFSEAVGQLEETLHLNPQRASAHNLMGVALKSMGDWDSAVKHYQEALRLRPDYPQAHNNLANVMVHMDRFEEAIYHYRQALALKPDYQEARINLEYILSTTSKEELP